MLFVSYYLLNVIRIFFTLISVYIISIISFIILYFSIYIQHIFHNILISRETFIFSTNFFVIIIYPIHVRVNFDL